MGTRLYPVIMSGGAGTRLWPLSRSESPKQFHALATDQSLFADTLARIEGDLLVEVEAPVVLTHVSHGDLVAETLNTHGRKGRILLEPEGRNTAAAAGMAAHLAASEGEGGVILLLSADHVIKDTEAFHEAIRAAIPLAEKDHFVTLGIEPTEPATGFGYIKQGAPIDTGFELARFVEKPDLKTAEKYLKDGGYFWNAGIFIFSADMFLKELSTFRPDIAIPLADAFSGGSWDGISFTPSLDAWMSVAKESIDYAVAEKTDKGAMVPVNMGWSDIGSWDALFAHGAADAAGNVVQSAGTQPEPILSAAFKNYIRSDSGRTITVAGVEDLIIVDTPDALFIGKRGDSQSVKEVVELLKKAGRTDLL